MAFGEILWDLLPTGPKLGGAPVNFLYHAHKLGTEVQALTKIGNDQLGKDILARLDGLEIPKTFVQISTERPTGTVRVHLDVNGTPSYEIVENVAWDQIDANAQVCKSAVDFLTANNVKGAFYYGSLALRSAYNRQSLENVVEALPPNILKICDLNVRPPFYTREVFDFSLNVADVFKLNDLEAVMLDEIFTDQIPASLEPLRGPSGEINLQAKPKREVDDLLCQWAQRWQKRFRLQTIILTCGSAGAYLFTGERAAFSPAVRVEVKDSVGAGDAFAAVCVVGLMNGCDEQEIVNSASRRAAFVCSQEGGTPDIPLEEMNSINFGS